MNNNDMNIINRLLCEQEEPEDIIKIFYSDLDLNARKKILDAINKSNDNIDVFSDDIVRNKIEDELKNKPILITRGSELINKMNIDF